MQTTQIRLLGRETLGGIFVEFDRILESKTEKELEEATKSISSHWEYKKEENGIFLPNKKWMKDLDKEWFEYLMKTIVYPGSSHFWIVFPYKGQDLEEYWEQHKKNPFQGVDENNPFTPKM